MMLDQMLTIELNSKSTYKLNIAQSAWDNFEAKAKEMQSMSKKPFTTATTVELTKY